MLTSHYYHDHNYSNGIEYNLQVIFSEEFTPLPVTPSKPPVSKKPASSGAY